MPWVWLVRWLVVLEFQGGLKDNGFLENVKDVLTVKDVMQVCTLTSCIWFPVDIPLPLHTRLCARSDFYGGTSIPWPGSVP